MKLASTLFVISAALVAAAPPPTFNRDVLPILQTRCQTCHRPGEIGPMPLLTYQQARPWAVAIKEAVLSGKMPPWQSDTPSQKFHNDPSLTAGEKQKIANWASQGAPEGKSQDARPNPSFISGWNIGQPDRIFTPSKRFEIPANGTIEYTYYIIPEAFEKDTWITAAEFRPGNRAVMHHGTVFVRPPQSKWLRGYATGEYFVPKEQFHAPDAKHPAATTNAGATAMDNGIITYVPGYVAAPMPESHAIFVPAGSDLILQLHYTANGNNASDLPSIGFRFTGTVPEKQLVTLVALNDTFVIPPGAADYAVRGKTTLGSDCDLYSLFPHMHVRGRSILLKATYPDGASEILLNVPYYDFNWQQKYSLASPKHLPAGTILEADATFDNSLNNAANPAPEREVRWGDQSWDEMMVGFFDVSIPSSMDKKLLHPPAPKTTTPPETAGK
jgi:hypothetical protein